MRNNNASAFFSSIISLGLSFFTASVTSFGQSALPAPVTAQAVCGDPSKIDSIVFTRFQGEFSSTNAGVESFCNSVGAGGSPIGLVRLGDAMLTADPQMLYQDGVGGLFDVSPVHLEHLIPQVSLPAGAKLSGTPWKYSTTGGFVSEVDAGGLSVGYGDDTSVHLTVGVSMLSVESLPQPSSPSAGVASHCGPLLETAQGYSVCLYNTGRQNFIYRPSAGLGGLNFVDGMTFLVGLNPTSIAIVGNSILAVVPSTSTALGSLQLLDINGNVLESTPLDVARPNQGFLTAGVAGFYVTANGGNGYDTIWLYQPGKSLVPLVSAKYGEVFGSPLVLK